MHNINKEGFVFACIGTAAITNFISNKNSSIVRIKKFMVKGLIQKYKQGKNIVFFLNEFTWWQAGVSLLYQLKTAVCL